MECDKCKNRFVLWGFSFYDCEICKEHNQWSSIPSPKLCEDCSNKNGLCMHCGEKIENI